MFVMIGPVPVPISLQGKAFVTCAAGTAAPVKGAFVLEASATIGGSLRVLPNGGAPTSWVSEGRWPGEASGSASVTPTLESSWPSSISCALPRVEVHATVAGIAGPYIAMSPSAILDQNGASVEARVAAGVGAGMLGIGTGVEVTLYTWRP
jgi:hypothetical protein